jgi:hypothetical protein
MPAFVSAIHSLYREFTEAARTLETLKTLVSQQLDPCMRCDNSTKAGLGCVKL